MKTIIVVESVYEKGKAVFDRVDDLDVVITTGEEESLASRIEQTGAFGVVLGGDRYSGRLYDSLPRGGIIARYGVGFDGVDLEKAKARGILVTNTPDVLARTVAESTVLLAGECLRRFGESSLAIQAGKWAPIAGRDFFGKTWAIIGLGSIGKMVARILAFGFGVNVIALKRNSIDLAEAEREYGVSAWYDDFAELVATADFVSLHLPANNETVGYIDRDKLAVMPERALLINTGRGALIDEAALYDTIAAGRLAGAGLDVFDIEPYRPVGGKDLRTLDGVVMTPHVGSNTVECNARMAERVLRNLRAAASGSSHGLDLVF